MWGTAACEQVEDGINKMRSEIVCGESGGCGGCCGKGVCVWGEAEGKKGGEMVGLEREVVGLENKPTN